MQFITRQLGLTEYQATLLSMQTFTANRSDKTADEIWLTEHNAIYTLGLNRKNVRLPVSENIGHNIPVILVDRGGKITYHGLGQIIIYMLIDLKRRNINVRQLVNIIETSIIELLSEFGVIAYAKQNAPGVYVAEKKVASLGLRLKNNCCYHGLSLNVDMNLMPFKAIDPCGYVGLEVTQTKDLGITLSKDVLGKKLLSILSENLHR